MQEEIWREFQLGYEVSDLGRIKKTRDSNVVWIKSGKKVSPKHRYLSIFINKQAVFIHELVAKLFVLNEKPEYYTSVLHLDGNIANNSASNLAWVHPLMIPKRTDKKKEKTKFINNIQITPMFKATVNVGDAIKVLGLFESETKANIAAKLYLKYK